MWLSTAPISLIRYLVQWRVRAPLVRLPPSLPVAISSVLGALIAERLPTQQARPWRKALSQSQAQAEKGRIAATHWPVEGIVFVPPGKRTYGRDETVWWELKLLGPHADHGLFLELFLPAIEAAAATRDPRWFANFSLWGHFDVQAIYVASGVEWMPLAEDGRLNLTLRPSASRWAEGLWQAGQLERKVNRLRWVTPFTLGAMPNAPGKATQSPQRSKASAAVEVPTLEGMVKAFLRRAAYLQHGRGAGGQDPWSLLEPAERSTLQEALAASPAAQRHTLVRAPKAWPGRWIGEQTFASSIPLALLPYLNLAAILHIGDYTHYGCGAFRLK